jgi:plasmid stabilization system protein ParE
MAYKIVWSEDAGDELVETVSYYKARAGKNIAKNIHIRIKNKVKKLLDGPKMGMLCEIGAKRLDNNCIKKVYKKHS